MEYSYNDHPLKYSLILYTKNCNFQCFKCHNRKLAWWDYVNPTEDLKWEKKNINVEDFYKKLSKYDLNMAIENNLIDMLIFCWGEFLINNIDEIIETINYVKIKNPKLLIRIDTNWSFPEKVKYLSENWYVDWFAIDLKWPYWDNKYLKQTSEILWISTEYAKKIFPKIMDSINISKKLKHSLFRTVRYTAVENEDYFKSIYEYAKNNLNWNHTFNEFFDDSKIKLLFKNKKVIKK